jgi:hypothetical protein
MNTSARLSISALPLCLAWISLSSCGVLYEYQGSVKSKSYSYSFGRDGSSSLPRYSLSVTNETKRQSFTRRELECGLASGAVEFRFTLERSVLLLWWEEQNGSRGYPCYAAFQETTSGMVSHDGAKELELLTRAGDYFGITQIAGQPRENLKHVLQQLTIKQHLIPDGSVFSYVEIH